MLFILALIRYDKVPSDVKRGFNQYAGNFSQMMHAHTGIHILQTPSVNRFEDSKCRLTLNLM